MSMARICFLVEEAHWFYDDFVRPLDYSLPAMSLRKFCLAMFRRCPLLAPFPIEDHIRAYDEFLKYKTSVPVRGAILLDETMTFVLLVKGWKKGANWSFPKGKINMDEDDLDCAIREVDEETGFDIRAAGLVPPPADVFFIDNNFRDQQIRLYVFRNVPMDTHFEPKTRKEIGGIKWYKISDLPTQRKKNATNNTANGQGQPGQETDDVSSVPNPKFYMVNPFVGPLRKWVSMQRKKDVMHGGYDHLVPQVPYIEDIFTEDETAPEPEPTQKARTPANPEELLANASRELQRLLNMQPVLSNRSAGAPVAPVPPAGAPAHFADTSQSKANALLAVLQQGGDASLRTNAAPLQPGIAAPVPHTPLDHTYNQAPQPNTPQHQHYGAQQAAFLQQQGPPPPFQQHVPHFSQPHPPYGQFGGPRPDLQQPQRQQQPPMQPYQQHPLQMHPQQQGYQGKPLQQRFQYQQPPMQGQSVPEDGVNPFALRNPPPPYSLQAAGNVQGPAQSTMHAPQQPPQPPVPLLHPQPLPPTVQKALFARESLISPDVAVAGPYAAGRQGNMMLPPPPPQHRGPQAPLSSHAASLLNAFKKDDAKARPENAASGAAASGWQQQPPQAQAPQPQPRPTHQLPQQFPHQAPQNIMQQMPQGQQPFGNYPGGQPAPHQLHGARPQPGPRQQYGGALHVGAAPAPLSSQGVPQDSNPFAPLNPSGPAQPTGNMPAQFNAAPLPTQHTEQHRNALLGMFKQTTTVQVQASAPMPPQNPGAAGGPHGVATQRAVFATTMMSKGPVSGQPLEVASPANGGVVEMNGEAGVNAPFASLSLFTQPNGADGGTAQQQPPAQMPTFSTPIAELPAATLRKQPSIPRQVGHQQQFSNRPQVDSPGDGRPSTRGSQQQQQQPYGISSVSNSIGIRSPSFASSSSTAPVDASAGPFPHASQPHPQQQQQQQQSPQLAAGMGGRRAEPANPEHKQKLLSLFGMKPQGSPGGGGGGLGLGQGQGMGMDMGAGGMLPYGHALAPPAPTSSPGSVEHGGGGPKGKAQGTAGTAAEGSLGGASRRGSQTPISPADRSFLLGYLASRSGP